ncbi:MAG: DUF4845 domain-containing protein [Sideroxydans sp.]|nr:DUF4845 domain-containing protein [Sideroxydans sp.]
MNMIAHQQRGVSFLGFLMLAFVLIFVAIIGMKMVPAYIHSAQIAQIFKSISDDPTMQTAALSEIKMSYSKKANINYINDITSEDIDIEKDDGHLILRADYVVKIPLVANITLLLEFHPSSAQAN